MAARDETDREERRARGELPAAADFFEMSLDNLCIVGFDGYFIRVNPSWSRTLGWTAEELLAMQSDALLHPDDHARTLAARAELHRGGGIGALRNRYRCKDGTYRWFEWRSVAELDRKVVFAAARDITEQIVAEERLRESKEQQEQLQRQLLLADRMAAVGTLAAGSAHEINNPLTVVMTHAFLLLEEIRTLEQVLPADQLADLAQLAEGVRAGGDRIRTIVRGLSTFARVAEERPAVIELTEVIERAIRLTSNQIQYRASLVRDYRPAPHIVADGARLEQVFINLLVNAAQAIPEGTSGDHEIRIVTRTDQDGRAVIEVRDTGEGIPAAIIDRVFDPFFTTKPIGVGTGLGLSVCYNIVTSMGGSLSVASGRDRGTSVRIVLAAAPVMQPEVAAPIAPNAGAGRRGTVLVVDDEPSVGRAVSRVLDVHDVTITTSAREALEVLESSVHFDVILSDLMMPEMSGMELYDQIARRFPEVAARVVFISGGAFTQAARDFLERVDNPRLEKPFDFQTLRAVVQRHVDGRLPGPAPRVGLDE